MSENTATDTGEHGRADRRGVEGAGSPRSATPCCGRRAPSRPGRASSSTSRAAACSPVPAVGRPSSPATPSSSRVGVAELLPGPRRRGHQRARGQELRHEADRDHLRPLWRPPRPRVPRRAGAHRPALLRELALHRVRARHGPSPAPPGLTGHRSTAPVSRSSSSSNRSPRALGLGRCPARPGSGRRRPAPGRRRTPPPW